MKIFGKELTFNGLNIFHTGNFNPATKSDTSHTHTSLVIPDTRAVDDLPAGIPARAISAAFKNNTSVGAPPVSTGGTYAHIINVNGWQSGNAGGGGQTAQIAVGNTLAIRQSTGESTWGPWSKLWHDNNDGSGSGLDADTLDGIHASGFSLITHGHTIADIPNLQTNLDAKISVGTSITLPASVLTKASMNMPHGVAPTTLVNGDIWTTTASLFARLNGTTRTIYHNGNAGTAALTTVTQAEAEAGTSTTVRAWTPQRVLQAINKFKPTKLSELTNDIGAGGGTVIHSPGFTPLNPSAGDFWYKEV